MRILIDCFKLVKGTGKSIGIYNHAVNLVKNLAESRGDSGHAKIRNAEIIVLGNSMNRKDFQGPGRKFLCIRNYDPQNKIHCIIWEMFAVSALSGKLKADEILFVRGFNPVIRTTKDIAIIHDMIPFYYKEHFPGYLNGLENFYIRHRLLWTAKTCDRIITISQESKEKILQYSHVAPEKITVIYDGCNELAYEHPEGEKNAPYICALTSGLPHKNATGILEAYRAYCRIAGNPLPLKVIGVDESYGRELPKDVRDRIFFRKYFEDNREFYGVIANAEVFLFLSLAEGFGFPPIEAMQLGVPVVCSDRSSLPEIVGDGACLVDPEKPMEVAAALDRLIHDEEEKARLIRNGLKNIQRYEWKKIAREYWKAIYGMYGKESYCH